MEVRGGKGQKAYVKFTMHSKYKEDKKMHSKDKEEISREVPTDSYDSDTEDMPLLLRRLLF